LDRNGLGGDRTPHPTLEPAAALPGEGGCFSGGALGEIVCPVTTLP
jgi:hypothetical protein